jgi:phosphoglycolate phosphatase-like HAD superfamily hydrolase
VAAAPVGSVTLQDPFAVRARCSHSTLHSELQRRPHTQEPANRPSPRPAAAERLEIDLPASYFIGDTVRDVKAALAVGVTPILIDWPYNRDLEVRYRVKDLGEAVELIG